MKNNDVWWRSVWNKNVAVKSRVMTLIDYTVFATLAASYELSFSTLLPEHNLGRTTNRIHYAFFTPSFELTLAEFAFSHCSVEICKTCWGRWNKAARQNDYWHADMAKWWCFGKRFLMHGVMECKWTRALPGRAKIFFIAEIRWLQWHKGAVMDRAKRELFQLK